MERAIYNVQRNSGGKLMLMMSGGRKKYPWLPEANTEILCEVDGEAWTLKVAQIAINKGWRMDSTIPGKDNHLPTQLAEWFWIPVVDKTGKSNNKRKGCKVQLVRTGDTWRLEPYKGE